MILEPESVLCERRDSNPHGLLHTPLKRTCLPVPPLPLKIWDCKFSKKKFSHKKTLNFFFYLPKFWYLCWQKIKKFSK